MASPPRTLARAPIRARRGARASARSAAPAPSRADESAAPARRDEILQAALSCFAARGFKGTTTREIAARVGLTEAALYKHFRGKEAIYEAIVDRKMARPDLPTRLADAAKTQDDEAVFGGLARMLIDGLQSDPEFLRLLLYTGLEGHSLAEPFFARRVAPLREFLSAYLARRMKAGAFRRLDPVLAARAFLGMVWDWFLVREIFGQRATYPHSTELAAGTFVSLFLDGVRKRPARTGARRG